MAKSNPYGLQSVVKLYGIEPMSSRVGAAARAGEAIASITARAAATAISATLIFFGAFTFALLPVTLLVPPPADRAQCERCGEREDDEPEEWV